jgi:hypothetical protein
MKIALALILLSGSAFARVPSTLGIRCTGSAPSSCASQGVLAKSHLETIGTDQFLVLYGSENNARCVISKASAAKQGVTIDFLNDMAGKYQVEVTCLYIFPLYDGQVSANDFSFRASIR